MIHIDPNRTFLITDEAKTYTYAELIESIDEEDRPKTKEQLRDLLWCFGIDETEIQATLDSCK